MNKKYHEVDSTENKKPVIYNSTMNPTESDSGSKTQKQWEEKFPLLGDAGAVINKSTRKPSINEGLKKDQNK